MPFTITPGTIRATRSIDAANPQLMITERISGYRVSAGAVDPATDRLEVDFSFTEDGGLGTLYFLYDPTAPQNERLVVDVAHTNPELLVNVLRKINDIVNRATSFAEWRLYIPVGNEPHIDTWFIEASDRLTLYYTAVNPHSPSIDKCGWILLDTTNTQIKSVVSCTVTDIPT